MMSMILYHDVDVVYYNGDKLRGEREVMYVAEREVMYVAYIYFSFTSCVCSYSCIVII